MRQTVLIVDDHGGFRRVARNLLDALGYIVVGESATGSDAIRDTARLKPDIILLDVQLPDIDGFAVAASVGSAAGAPRIILISSRDAADYGLRLASSSAVGFIAKTDLNAESLMAVLRDD